MIKLSKAFKRELYYNHRNYLAYADITLASGTVLHLTNKEIWSGGFYIEDAVSPDDSFQALGSTIINAATLIVNNMDENYSDYDFTGAKVVLYLGMNLNDDGTTRLEKIKMGTFTVDEPLYNGGTITLECLDYMEQFDRPYSGSSLAYPATLDQIVRNACTKCGVSLNTYDFPHKDYVVQKRPEDDALTYREVIAWAATIAGCFARCNKDGKLELKWFDQTTLEARSEGLDGGIFDTSKPYSSGVTADGGTFNPWSVGYAHDEGTFEDEKDLHYITSLYSQNISIDDVVITGIRITLEVETDTSSETKIYTSGKTGYMIDISGNEFITVDTAQQIANWLGEQLIGLTFRKASVEHANNPSIEAGDIALLWDRKGREYPILITYTGFSVGGTQSTISAAETPSRNSATRYNQATKSYVDARKLMNHEKTNREAQLEELADKLAESSGLYSTVETTSSGSIYYLHNMPKLDDSNIVWKMTTSAWGVSTNGGKTWNAGMTVDGDAITRILSAVGVDADWITTGIISDASGKNSWNLNTGLFSMTDGTIKLGDDFSVTSKGKLTTKNADITGKITANTGKIGQFTISDSALAYTGTSEAIRLTDGGIRSWELVKSAIDGYENYGAVRIGEGRIRFYGGKSVNPSTYAGSITAGKKYYGSGDSAYIDEVTITDKNDSACFRLSTSSIDLTKHDVRVLQDLWVYGEKSRIAKTEDFGDRAFYCYESPSPMFGDIGEAVIAEDGIAYIDIDPIFGQAVNTGNYQVFLQKYGEGDLYVSNRFSTYFSVLGTPGLRFGWEIKAKQAGYDQLRLSEKFDSISINEKDFSVEVLSLISSSDLGDEAAEYIQEITEGRIL